MVDDPDFFMLLVPGSFFIWLQDQFGDYPLEPGKSVLKLELVLELIFLSVSYKLNQFLNWFKSSSIWVEENQGWF